MDLPEAPWKLDPERVAYWYLRLNGFLQLENFVVHPPLRGAQRTDADLLAVRFPFRAERLYDDQGDVMADDEATLGLSRSKVDVVIAEVKTGRCRLNGPWTKPERRNVHRALAAIGCLPPDLIDTAADDIYRRGLYEREDKLRIRLICIGRTQCTNAAASYPEVKQVMWEDVLGFIWRRLCQYRRQKTQTDQWPISGRRLKEAAAATRDAETFITKCLNAMTDFQRSRDLRPTSGEAPR